MKKRVLIVDDSPLACQELEACFQSLDWEIAAIETQSLNFAQVYEKLLPDLVSLDLIMPHMDGLECYGWLKKNYPEAPVIMVSYLEWSGTIQNIFSPPLPSTSFFQKPLIPEKLASTLEKIFPSKIP